MANLSMIKKIHALLPLLLLLLATTFIWCTDANSTEAPTPSDMVPVGPTKYFEMGGPPFRKCSPCKCCAGSTCSETQCCYGIKCNLPGKPFGTCAFQPIACNCNSCGTA